MTPRAACRPLMEVCEKGIRFHEQLVGLREFYDYLRDNGINESSFDFHRVHCELCSSKACEKPLAMIPPPEKTRFSATLH